jgi:DNA replication protein DnaC
MELASKLAELKLAGIKKTYETRNKEAIERKLSYVEFLSLLLEDETRNREANGIKKRVASSHLPNGKTLDTYDFSFQPKINKKLIFDLATCGFMEKKENIIFMGQPGTGKTHLATSIGQKALLAGYRVLFTTVTDMITVLHQSKADGSYENKMKYYLAPDLLILDELGFKKLSEYTVYDFFEIISKRYEQKSLIITSNKTFEEWDSIFFDQVLATAIIDRLVHHSHPICITGESYRVKEHMKNKNNLN